MRLTRIAAATLVAGSLTFAGTGIALADTVTPVTAGSSSISAVAEPGLLQLSATTVKPGSQITFSGTFAEPAASTATGPITVTSPAFAGPATFTHSMPEAFSGSATIANSVKPGTYTVTASSSAGTVSAKLTVPGTVPPPVPAHHTGGTTGSGTHTAGHGSSGTEAVSTDTGIDTTTVSSSTDPAGSDMLPWVLGGAGVLVLAGGGAYVIGRGRRDNLDAQARQDDREPRTEVMPRR